ncbi:amidohydrolase [Pseudomonas tolaasii]|uniref:amidohydrolase n=1 Tax=Pseudomonas tolaasii TaxID=29442 RepID=UPI0018E1B737|nr:amidohydrolase [Pseudomonas tolaasii]
MAVAAGFHLRANAIPVVPDDGKATMVFHKGTVFTVDEKAPWASAVAVRESKIIYVGDDEGVKSFIGSSTMVYDLAGRLLMPGFVEAHIHPIVGPTITQGLDLQYNTREEILEVLLRHKKENGDAKFVRGYGWRYSAFPHGPSKADLDAIWPDIPVFLIAVDAHSAWANSKAFELAGIGPDKEDPQKGFSYYKRDPHTKQTTGWIVEVAAMVEVMSKVAPISIDSVVKATEDWLPRAAQAGITSVLDAGMQLLPEQEGFKFYMRMAQKGKLPFRVVGTHYHNNPKIDPVPIIAQLKKTFQSEYVRASVLKLNMDGVESARTAALLAPYSDMKDHSGKPILTQSELDGIVKRADALGIDIHVHSIGDRSTRMTLDAIERAIATNPARDRRHSIAHLQLVHPDDLPRFKKLGVIGQFSAQWAVPDIYWNSIVKSRFGATRANDTYRFGSILRSGAKISLGTDWPAASNYSTFKPLDALEIAVTRSELGSKEQPPLPPADDRITLEQAVRANTLVAAYQLNMEKEIGSIEVGKRADLIILDKNIFTLPVNQIHSTNVLLTVMDGDVKHSAKSMVAQKIAVIN